MVSGEQRQELRPKLLRNKGEFKMVIILNILKVAFLLLMFFMLCVALFTFFLVVFEPEKENLSKIDWKNGYIEKRRFK